MKLRRAVPALLLLIYALVSPTGQAQAVVANGANAVDELGEYSSGTTVTYTKGNPNNSPSATAGFDSPYSLALDAGNHRLFVADTLQNRVLVYSLNTDNSLNSKTAVNVLGQSSLTTGTKGTTQSTMWNPNGLAYDATNNRLFVADNGNSRVLVFNTSTITNGMNAANVLGQSSFTASGHSVTQSTMFSPHSVAYDATNNRLFVGDNGNDRVLVFSLASITNGMNAANVLGEPDFTTATGGLTQALIKTGGGLAYDAPDNYLFVSDSTNNRVLVFSLASITNGMNATYVLGPSSFTANTFGTTQALMYAPDGLTYDSGTTTLFVADARNNRVLLFNTSTITNGMNAANVLGEPDFTTNTGGTTQATMRNSSLFLNGLAYDATNTRFFVADTGNNRVLVFSLASITNGMNAADVLGQSNFTTGRVDGIVSALGFDQPNSATVDVVHHRLFVADSGNNRVLVFTLNTDNSISSKTPANVLGEPDFTTFTAGTTTQATINYPIGLAYDGTNDRLFVADQSNNRILVFNTSTITNGMNAANVLGAPDFTTNTGGTTTQATMGEPWGVAYDATNNRLFVADTGNSRVLVFNTSTITNGMNAANVLGEPDFTTYTGGLTQALMENPQGVAYDATNNRLFVADFFNGRVLVFNVATVTDAMNAANVLGEPDFTTDNGSETQAGLCQPSDVSYDPIFNRLFALDGCNNRVLVYSTSTITNGMNATKVLGQTSFTGSNSGTTQSLMLGASGVVYNSANEKLFVSDTSNNRVMVFDGTFMPQNFLMMY